MTETQPLEKELLITQIVHGFWVMENKTGFVGHA